MLLLSFTVVETAEVISHEVFRETVLVRRDLSATQPPPKKNFDTLCPAPESLGTLTTSLPLNL